MSEEQIKLNLLKPGEKGEIVNINIGGPSGQRLMDMGFIPGSKVEVVRNAPLVDPVELKVRENSVSIRHAEAKFIEVIKNG